MLPIETLATSRRNIERLSSTPELAPVSAPHSFHSATIAERNAMILVECFAFGKRKRSCSCHWKGSKETAARNATEAKSPGEVTGRSEGSTSYLFYKHKYQ